MANPTKAGSVALDSRASRLERNEQLFQSLPRLGSPEYLTVLQSATRAAMPAGVLVRAYRKLAPSDAADRTLERLLDRDDPPGYIVALRAAARQRTGRIGAYTSDDLLSNAIGEIVATINGSDGKIAEGAWALYLQRCLENAYRALVGRGGSRLGSHAASSDSTRDADDSIDHQTTASIAWRARLEPSNLEWLEAFIERTIAEIEHEAIRAVGLDLFSQTPTRISSADPNDPNTLAGRFHVTRSTIHRWQRDARAILYDALSAQDECDIDMSFLEFEPN